MNRQEKPLQQLLSFLQGSEPMLLVIGEPDSGKTRLIQAFSAHRYWRMHVLQTKGHAGLTEEALLKLIAEKWGFQLSTRSSSDHRHLNELMDKLAEKEDPYVIIIDDADQCPLETLAALSYLAIHQPDGYLTLRMVLLGQPELQEKTNRLMPHNAEWPMPLLYLEPEEYPDEEEEEEEEELEDQEVAASHYELAEEEETIPSGPAFQTTPAFETPTPGYVPEPTFSEALQFRTEDPIEPHASGAATMHHADPLGLEEDHEHEDEPDFNLEGRSFYEKHRVKIISTVLLGIALWILYSVNQHISESSDVAVNAPTPVEVQAYPPPSETSGEAMPAASEMHASAAVEPTPVPAPVTEVSTAQEFNTPTTAQSSATPQPTAATPPVSEAVASVEPVAIPTAVEAPTTAPSVAVPRVSTSSHTKQHSHTAAAKTKMAASHRATMQAKAHSPAHATAANGYTLQLMGLYETAPLKQFIQKNHLAGRATIRHTHFQGKDWYILTLGHYKTPQEAHQAMSQLPAN